MLVGLWSGTRSRAGLNRVEDVVERIIETAKKTALTSEGCGYRNFFRVGAVLFKKNKVVAAKPNTLKTHPILVKFGKRWPFLHAESHAIISHGIDNCEGLDLLVVRVNRSGEFLYSKPCESCQSLMDYSGIRRAHYSDYDGTIFTVT